MSVSAYFVFIIIGSERISESELDSVRGTDGKGTKFCNFKYVERFQRTLVCRFPDEDVVLSLQEARRVVVQIVDVNV